MVCGAQNSTRCPVDQGEACASAYNGLPARLVHDQCAKADVWFGYAQLVAMHAEIVQSLLGYAAVSFLAYKCWFS